MTPGGSSFGLLEGASYSDAMRGWTCAIAGNETSTNSPCNAPRAAPNYQVAISRLAKTKKYSNAKTQPPAR
jgi:hypothetical protein